MAEPRHASVMRCELNTEIAEILREIEDVVGGPSGDPFWFFWPPVLTI